MPSKFIAAVLLMTVIRCVSADTVYLAPDEFLRQAFSEPPSPSVLWLDQNIQKQLSVALGHSYPQARLRYWRAAGKTVWMLDEIGKEYPITAGFVVGENRIERAQVLIYRESRGDEIHLPAFLRQFVGSTLTDDHLSNRIDGITGATLSVNAMQRMARAALVLDQLAK